MQYLQIKFIKILFIAFLLSIFCASKLSAQSTVYIFLPKIGNHECFIYMNGEKLFEMRGPLKKTYNLGEDYSTPYRIYSACQKKAIFQEEGKIILSFKSTFTYAKNGNTTDLAAEIQLNLTPGSVHYVKITNKGLNDVKMLEIKEKEGLKLLNNKSYVKLPDYIQEAQSAN